VKTFADFGIDLGGRGGIEVACQCPQCSASRKKKNTKPLSANTEKGVWHCNHCGWSGSLTQGEQTKAQIRKLVSRPTYRDDAAKRTDALYESFEKRGIPREIVDRNQITLAPAYMPQSESYVECIHFPYVKDGEVVNVKYRGLSEKIFRQHAGAEKVLFGMGPLQSLRRDPSTPLVIVEGEVDALSLQVAGIPCGVSVPDGAPDPRTKKYSTKFEYLENCHDFLEGFQKVIIAVDGDEPGRRLADELVRRIGPERCYIVQWPEGCKDANEVLLHRGPAELATLIQDAKPVPLEGVFEVADVAEDVVELYRNQQAPGVSTGWGVVDEYYTVKPGEMTIVTGIPSHGKSEWLDALMVNMAEIHGWSCGIFSPENFPVANHVAKLLEKYVGKSFRGGWDRLNSQEMVTGLEWAHQHFYFAVHGEDTLNLDAILLKAQGMVQRYGIRLFLIDPWNEIDHTRPDKLSEVEYISQSLTKIRRFGRKYGVHMIVVAHPQKLYREKDGTYPVPTLYDISGAAHWRNKADNGIVIWRDVLDDEQKTTVFVQKIKNRQNGKVGHAVLYWTPKGGRYLEQPIKPHGNSESKAVQTSHKRSLSDYTASARVGSQTSLGIDSPTEEVA
jgi:twinkle protein